MRRLLNEFLVLIGYYRSYYKEEIKMLRTCQGDYDFEFIGTGKIIKQYEKRNQKLPF